VLYLNLHMTVLKAVYKILIVEYLQVKLDETKENIIGFVYVCEAAIPFYLIAISNNKRLECKNLSLLLCHTVL